MKTDHQHEQFFIVYNSFISELKLSGLELTIYSLLYSFCVQGHGHYNGSVQYLADRINASKNGVRKTLNKLLRKGLIEKAPPARVGKDCPIYTLSKAARPLHSVHGAGILSGQAGKPSGDNRIHDINNKMNQEIDPLTLSRSELLTITDSAQRERCVRAFAYLFEKEDPDQYPSSYLRIVDMIAEMIVCPQATYKGQHIDADTIWEMLIDNLRDDLLGPSIRDRITVILHQVDRMNIAHVNNLNGYLKAVIWDVLEKGRLSEY